MVTWESRWNCVFIVEAGLHKGALYALAESILRRDEVTRYTHIRAVKKKSLAKKHYWAESGHEFLVVWELEAGFYPWEQVKFWKSLPVGNKYFNWF